jgi:hypothetical protein
MELNNNQPLRPNAEESGETLVEYRAEQATEQRAWRAKDFNDAIKRLDAIRRLTDLIYYDFCVGELEQIHHALFNLVMKIADGGEFDDSWQAYEWGSSKQLNKGPIWSETYDNDDEEDDEEDDDDNDDDNDSE